jgi:hypothetical protein
MSVTYGTVVAARSDAEAPRYGRSVTGYGPKIPTRHWVKLAGDTRWRRVYAAIYGNAGSLFAVVRGTDVYLDDTDLELALGR